MESDSITHVLPLASPRIYKFSLGINLLLKCRTFVWWILRWHEGEVLDTGNLLRAAKWNELDNPLNLTLNKVEARLFVGIQELHT
jgi:hypothetical protein